AAVTAAVTFDKAIVTLPVGALLPITCQAFDRNGYPIVGAILQAKGRAGLVAGTTCGELTINRSGIDTLLITAGAESTRLPLVVAVRVAVSSTIGDDLSVDSFPSGGAPWAPTAWVDPQRQVTLFSTVYYLDSTSVTGSLARLDRFTSSDGVHFRYGGVALERDSEPCSLEGTGIENVAIIPRSDGPGWRMIATFSMPVSSSEHGSE